MGFASGSRIFNDIAAGLVQVPRTDPAVVNQLVDVLVKVTEYLHSQDWDTCDEVVACWSDNTLVMTALVKSGCADGHQDG